MSKTFPVVGFVCSPNEPRKVPYKYNFLCFVLCQVVIYWYSIAVSTTFVWDGVFVFFVFFPGTAGDKNRQKRVYKHNLEVCKNMKLIIRAIGLFWTIIRHKQAFYKNVLHRKWKRNFWGILKYSFDRKKAKK